MILLNILCIQMYHIITIHNSLFLSTNLPGITLSFFLINNLCFSFTKVNVVFVSCMVTRFPTMFMLHSHPSSTCLFNLSNESYYWPTILTLLGILLWLNWSTSILNKSINLSMMTSLYEKLNRNICSYTILIGYYIFWSDCDLNNRGY